MFDSKRNVLFYLQPSAIPSLGASTESYHASSASTMNDLAATAKTPFASSTSSSTPTATLLPTTTSSYSSSSAARSRSTSGATALPALSEELICADVSQWLRFCDEARRRGLVGLSSSSSSGRAPVGLEDGQRYGVLNRKVVEVQSIRLPPSAASLLDPTIFPLLRYPSRVSCRVVCGVVCCVSCVLTETSPGASRITPIFGAILCYALRKLSRGT